MNLHVLLGLPHERGHPLSPALTPPQGSGGFRPFRQRRQPRVLSPLLPPARDEGHETCSECLVVNTSESEDDRVYHSAWTSFASTHFCDCPTRTTAARMSVGTKSFLEIPRKKDDRILASTLIGFSSPIPEWAGKYNSSKQHFSCVLNILCSRLLRLALAKRPPIPRSLFRL